MLVRCTTDQPDPHLHEVWLNQWANGAELEITRGSLYAVLAVSRYNGQYFVYVIGDETDRYPLGFPAALFEVVDGHLPASWNRAEPSVARMEELGLRDHQVCSFEPWAIEEDTFYEKILEEDPFTLSRFYAYRDSIMVG